MRRVDFPMTVSTATGDRLTRAGGGAEGALHRRSDAASASTWTSHYADRDVLTPNHRTGGAATDLYGRSYVLGECLSRTEATVLKVSREYLDAADRAAADGAGRVLRRR